MSILVRWSTVSLVNSLAFAVLLALVGSSSATTVEEIALMNRADRQKILVEGAKKEGKVALYTTLIVDQADRVKQNCANRVVKCDIDRLVQL